MDRVSAGASLLLPAAGINGICHDGGRAWRNKKDVDFPEAGEDTALCDKENKPPIARGSGNVFIRRSACRAPGGQTGVQCGDRGRFAGRLYWG
ncbi:hypothetical protein ACLB1E_29605 [Escherichia coli]